MKSGSCDNERMTLYDVDMEIAQKSYRRRLELFSVNRHNKMKRSMEIFIRQSVYLIGSLSIIT
jgi:hypothetical protein